MDNSIIKEKINFRKQDIKCCLMCYFAIIHSQDGSITGDKYLHCPCLNKNVEWDEICDLYKDEPNG